jgi:UDP-GlcNAc:undecaprenyl-phosphate/decaprenyl-phosphate GlcNAc-1-phosphate transferase
MVPVFSGVWVNDFTLPFLGGVRLDHVLFHDVIVLGNVKVGQVVTVLGFVAVMNVINFIDGVDGLAAGVCVISAATFAIIALSLDRPGAGVLAAATAGASLGFLRHGFPPASSFMGDTGSNLLGYLLATVAVLGALKTNAVVALFFPLIVLAVPILDGGFVIAKRLKYRRPVYEADRWHFHHRMANIGFSQRRTLVYLYGWASVLAGLALALRFVPYSDNHGHFNAAWTVVIVACGLTALAASVYLVVLLEILKLRRFRLRQLVGLRGPAAPAPDEVDAGVARELETGSFAALNPETGEFEVIDPDTGEFEAREQRGSEPARNHAFSDIFAPRRLQPACAGAERPSVPLAPDRPKLSRPEFESPDDREPSWQGGCRRRWSPPAGGDDCLRGGRLRTRLTRGPCRSRRTGWAVRGARRGFCTCLRSL